jgi:mannose-6-phosphate isomerase-like protein (cupin superfamily)
MNAYDRSEMAAWKATRLEEIRSATDGRAPWRPVRAHFDIRAFGVNLFFADEVGDRLVNEHDEADDGQEELYLVHTGRARFEIGGETVDAPAGTFVYAEPGVKRTAFAEEPGTTVLIVGGVPGHAYVVEGWEIWAPFHPLYEAGEYDQAADRLDTELPIEAPYPGAHFNAACVYSLAGRNEAALAHLRRSIELSERFREMAKSDTDLDAIRGEPGFSELVG